LATHCAIVNHLLLGFVGTINGANVYVLFPTHSASSPGIVQRIIAIPTDGEGGPVYKIANAISSHIGISIPPGSAISTEGLALKLYFRNSTCQDLAIKPLKRNPLSTITRSEWEVAKAQIAIPNLGAKEHKVLEAKPIETTISGATSTIPKIICLNDQGLPQGLVQQKPLPKSAIFSAIVIFGLFCSLLVVVRMAKNTSK